MSANLIGKRVRQARFKHNPKLTQQKLAVLLQLDGLDITQMQISKMENGIRPVTDFEVAAFAKVLNVSPLWLLKMTEEYTPLR